MRLLFDVTISKLITILAEDRGVTVTSSIKIFKYLPTEESKHHEYEIEFKRWRVVITLRP